MGDADDLAPVIPLFGGGGGRSAVARPEVDDRPEADDASAVEWRSTWAEAATESAADGEHDETRAQPTSVELAEKSLLRKLRTRSLSIAEARRALGAFELSQDELDAIVGRCEKLGYLDDAALAEQIVHAGVSRKGQGRRAIALTLTQRGVPREVAESAVRALPDDDAERALEFARTKARSLAALDRDTALRRLAGQLARRGFGGVTALAAARAALDEQAGVRFR